MNDTEQIVFVDEAGTPTGRVGPKLASHTSRTTLHLAFSCYIFRRSDNYFLMTQRALSKRVWPGVWTNSVCGHPGPGEKLEGAIRRRAVFELGLHDLEDITCVLPTYKYRTPPYNGIIENEFCPVFVAYATSRQVQPNPAEVEDYRWLPWSEYGALFHDLATKASMSYWAIDQYEQLKMIQPLALAR